MHVSNWSPPGTQEEDAAEMQDRRIVRLQMLLLIVVAVAFAMSMAFDYASHGLACVAHAVPVPC